MSGLFQKIFIIKTFYFMHVPVMGWHMICYGRVSFTVRLSDMNSNTTMLIIHFYHPAVIEHFYFLPHILVRHTVVKTIFPELHMIITLNSKYRNFLRRKGLRW